MFLAFAATGTSLKRDWAAADVLKAEAWLLHEPCRKRAAAPRCNISGALWDVLTEQVTSLKSGATIELMESMPDHALTSTQVPINFTGKISR